MVVTFDSCYPSNWPSASIWKGWRLFVSLKSSTSISGKFFHYIFHRSKTQIQCRWIKLVQLKTKRNWIWLLERYFARVKLWEQRSFQRLNLVLWYVSPQLRVELIILLVNKIGVPHLRESRVAATSESVRHKLIIPKLKKSLFILRRKPSVVFWAVLQNEFHITKDFLWTFVKSQLMK